jgi:hypothetical protein
MLVPVKPEVLAIRNYSDQTRDLKVGIVIHDIRSEVVRFHVPLLPSLGMSAIQ